MDEIIKCPKCKSVNIVKNGIVRGKQRYKCKSCNYNFVRKLPSKELVCMKALSTLINALGDLSYDELELLLNRDTPQLRRWSKAREMRKHRPTELDSSKTKYEDLEAYVAAHKKLFDPTLPLFTAAGSIVGNEFSVMLVVQRKYVLDYE